MKSVGLLEDGDLFFNTAASVSRPTSSAKIRSCSFSFLERRVSKKRNRK